MVAFPTADPEFEFCMAARCIVQYCNICKIFSCLARTKRSIFVYWRGEFFSMYFSFTHGRIYSKIKLKLTSILYKYV